MSENVDVAIGVVGAKVVARWIEPVTQIEFDAANAYKVGLALSHAALEAHKGARKSKDVEFIDGELAQVKLVVSDVLRDMLIASVATIVKTLQDQKKTPGYIAMHCVDAVLRETAR